MKNNGLLNILVPLDFSEASLNSLETAIALAKQQNAKISLLNVVDSSLMFAFKGVSYVSEKTINSIVDVSDRILAKLMKKLKEEHQLECTSETKVGLVPHSIVKTAYHIGADLIIMGTQGVSGFRKFFMGSNVQKVAKISSCPVLTIPLNQRWTKFRKILFPVRPATGTKEKFDFLMRVIGNIKPSIEIMLLASNYNDTEKKALRDKVKELKKDVIKNKLKASGTFKVGEKMSKAVLKMSKVINADMIVIGASRSLDFKQFFIGTFEQHILNHARTPVLFVRSMMENLDSQLAIQQINESFSNQYLATTTR